MFNYEFMRIAFTVGVLLALIIPLVGQTCVLKRLSTTGDALSHTALFGVALGLVTGSSPLVVAISTCILASLVIEFIRKKFAKYAELSVSIVMAFSIAMAAILSNFSNSANFSAYLFGSILLIGYDELIFSICIFIITIIFYFGFYHQIKYVAYNEIQAKLDGVNVNILNIVQTIITAIVIAISSKVIGALMVSALMVIPYASAIQISQGYKKSMILAIVFSLISMIIGLIVSFYLNLQPGGTIVLVAISILILAMILNKIFKFSK